MTSPTCVNRSTPAAVGLGDDADRAAVLDDDRGAVRPLADERERGVHGVVRADDDRGLDDRVPSP